MAARGQRAREYKMESWAIAVHGGAEVGPIVPWLSQKETEQLLTGCLEDGITALRSNLPAIDVVERVVKELETLPLFYSGRGSALTAKGTVEMEASIMDGPSRRCGAISGVTTVKNPVSLARFVMDNYRYSDLAFSGAEEIPGRQFDDRIQIGSRTAGATATDSPLQMNGLPISIDAPKTFGCVAVDSQGQCAAATSTGGLMNRMTGRIGCTATIGAGTYACDLCGVSCTGEDEAIMRGTLAREVAAVMEYNGLNLQQAVEWVIKERLDQGFTGLIAVSKNREVVCGFNRKGIFSGMWLGAWATGDQYM